MTRPRAKIIADSISPDGVRLTTFEVTCHRFVLAEFNTHRTLSRNSASSRAIPLWKQLGRVRTDPAEPLVWASEQKGMQGGDEVPLHVQAEASQVWLEKAAEAAIEAAHHLGEIGVHKSIANRLLEPFMWHTIVCTATAWENFFDQRCSPLAQPEIKAVADLMREAYEDSKPTPLDEGEWHLPYIADDDTDTWLQLRDYDLAHGGKEDPDVLTQACVKVSAARCARVSYLTQDGKRDIEQDLTLYERLVSAQPPHWSPLEHVATPWPWNRQEGCIHFPLSERSQGCVPVDHLPRMGNLLGWRSLRTTVEFEKGAVTYR